MAGNSQETILNAFNQAAGPQGSGGTSDVLGSLLPAAGQSLPEALTQATQVINAQNAATSANTDALAQDTQTKASGGSGTSAGDVVSTVSQLMGEGFSLAPLISIFTSLFGGGDTQQPAPVTPFSLPPSLNLEATSNLQDVVWSDNGMPKTSNGQPTAASQPAAQNSAPQQITVQVQTMDSQSFLDHSDDIARAVRQAMLNMNSINDVVSEL